MEGNRPVGRRRVSLRSRTINAVSATAFVIGGSLFALGAALAQGDAGGPRLAAGVYLAGGVFFSTGGYAAVLQIVNGPRAGRWRWWSAEPGRLEWLSTVALFVGTLVFAINLIDSLIGDLSPAQYDRLVWSPDMVGCALFLVSGHLAMVEISGTWLPCWRPRDLGWWIVAVNQLGSLLFMVSAVASLIRADGDMIAVGIANWGTLTGALCFVVAGVMQEFERPSGPSVSAAPERMP
jgi:hypothetical protein